jgi:hypothetical protein
MVHQGWKQELYYGTSNARIQTKEENRKETQCTKSTRKSENSGETRSKILPDFESEHKTWKKKRMQ